jgi:hypothetical protein
MYYVIVKDWHGKKEKKTRVSKDSVRIEDRMMPLASYAEAVRVYSGKIRTSSPNLTISAKSLPNVASIKMEMEWLLSAIQKKLCKATATAKQTSLGSTKGTYMYRHIEFQPTFRYI